MTGNVKSTPKNHHFIPQGVLRHFASDDGQLWFWRREFDSGEIKKSGTRQLFAENHLYSIIKQDGTKDPALEHRLANFDGVSAKFIRKLAAIVRAGDTPKLDDNAWNLWYHFFDNQLKRTPAYFEAIAERMGLDKALEEMIRNAQENEQMLDETGLIIQLRKNLFVNEMRNPPSSEILDELAKVGLVIYKINDSKKSFVVGDAPGAKAKFEQPGKSWSHSKLFFPLTWDIAVGTLGLPRQVRVVNVDRDQVRQMNIATAARSNLIAGRSDALIKSLSREVDYVGVRLH